MRHPTEFLRKQRMTPDRKSPTEIEAIAQTGEVLRTELLNQLKIAVSGVSLGQLRTAAEQFLQQAGCVWSPLPSPISLAVNERILSFDENDVVLNSGDVLSIDLSASFKGWWADMARTIAIGTPRLEHARLIRQSRQILALVRGHLDRTRSFQGLRRFLHQTLSELKLSMVPIPYLHGISRELHESPVLTPIDKEDSDISFEPGFVFTLEPVLTLNPADCRRDREGRISAYGSPTASFFEETFAVTESGIRCLTTPDVPARERNLVLIGMPGAGKSTVGRELARLTNRPFVDLDEQIECSEGKTLSELIAEHGFVHFLEIEANAAQRIEATGSIVSTGGSIVYRADAVETLRSKGSLIYLDVALDELQQRLSDLQQRGVVIDRTKSLHDLFLEREPLYEANYDFKISADDGLPTQTAEQIVAHFSFFLA
ncbi:MAG TPA: shikimate kinase [Planctomycetaceae bacterium]|nr:shikimate kinase [Planctomycetaceae bacterium]